MSRLYDDDTIDVMAAQRIDASTRTLEALKHTLTKKRHGMALTSFQVDRLHALLDSAIVEFRAEKNIPTHIADAAGLVADLNAAEASLS